MVSLTIDGRNVTVAKGTTILDAAAQLGIRIPTLCWLQKVSPTGACRICAVEVEGVERPMTACNTPVKEGIAVTTQSERLATIRRKVVELLLVNHPLDCPVCDAAGECDLQNTCYEHGAVKQEYAALLERRPIRYNWKLLESDPNRCILCEKCVKVDHEIVGADAIAAVNCGEATIIDTPDGGPLNCEFCGNCIAACPTGTLISKPFKFRARPWSLSITKSVCAFCSSGCQIEYHTKNGRVERVTSDDATYNSGNLCINGRFGYSAFNSRDRLTTPLVKEAGEQVTTDWDRAMDKAVIGLRTVVEQHGPAAVAGISSPRVTNEENYLFQKLLRNAIGSNNIDSEARLGYAPAQAVVLERLGLAGASATIDRIDNAAAVLVVGCDLNAEATGIEYRVIKAATKNDAKLVLANMRDVKLKKYANSHLKYRPGGELPLLNGLIKAVLDAGLEDKEFVARVSNLAELKEGLAGITLAELAQGAGVTEADLREAAGLFGGKQSIAVIFGADLMRSAECRSAVTALTNLAILTGCLGKEAGGLFPVDEKNNTQGLLDMGIAPDTLPGYRKAESAGKDLWQMIEGIEQGSIKALYLMGSDLLSFPNNGRIRQALAKLDFLLVQEVFPTETARLAHVVFPAATAAEKNGSFTTIDNRIQCLGRAIDPPGKAREDWDIISELISRFSHAQHAGSTAEVLAEIRENTPRYATGTCEKGDGHCTRVAQGEKTVANYAFAPLVTKAAPASDGFQILVGPILYHSGTTTAWSENNLTVAPEGYIEISTADAARLGIAEGDSLKVTSANGGINGKAHVTNRLQAGLLFAPSHFRALNANSLLGGSANVVSVSVEKA
jgi:formate dehydrogenase alpha subunit